MNFHRSRLAFAFAVFCHQSLEFVHRSCTLKTTAGVACWCFRGHVRPEHRCLAQFSAPSGAVLFLRCSFDACCFHATVCRTTAVFFCFFFNHKCSLKERGGAMSAAVYWLTYGLTLPLRLAFRDKMIALFLLLTWALTCAPLQQPQLLHQSDLISSLTLILPRFVFKSTLQISNSDEQLLAASLASGWSLVQDCFGWTDDENVM